MKLLGAYDNGNYTVKLYDDGTKVRYNNLDFFDPSTIESCDVKITNCCDMGCKMCHENSTPDGKHGDILSPSWLDKLHPFCELAIGGGNPLEHPQLEQFLFRCKVRHHIPSMTVNQVHFEKEFARIKRYCDEKLIYGLGVSLVKVTPEFIDKIKQIPTAVIHVINGLVTEEQLRALSNNNLKVLVLGYKQFRRGEKLYVSDKSVIDEKMEVMKTLIQQAINEKWFKVVSFDNLALKQLPIREMMTQEQWDRFYMGDDGIDGAQTSATFFVDMVERNFGKNSCDPNRYPLMETAEEMLQYLKDLHKLEKRND